VNRIDPDGMPLHKAHQLVTYILALDALSFKHKFQVRALEQAEYERMENYLDY
jgi:hypothetical protein